ncbi:MAG: hypothetical protein ACLFWF_13285 [Alphaproteobacteria bacterium]
MRGFPPEAQRTGLCAVLIAGLALSGAALAADTAAEPAPHSPKRQKERAGTYCCFYTAVPYPEKVWRYKLSSYAECTKSGFDRYIFPARECREIVCCRVRDRYSLTMRKDCLHMGHERVVSLRRCRPEGRPDGG